MSVVVSGQDAWEQARDTYNKHKKTTCTLSEAWFAHAQKVRERALFSTTVVPPLDESYERRLARWWTQFELSLGASVPDVSLPRTASAALLSLHGSFDAADKFHECRAKWIQLHSRFTCDVLRLVADTTRRLNEVRAWFHAVAREWQTQVRACQPAPQPAVKKSEFLRAVLPDDPDEFTRCFAESGCMVSVAKLLAVDPDFEKTATDLDCQARELCTQLTAAQSAQVTAVTTSACRYVRVAFVRTNALLLEETKRVGELEAACRGVADSILAVMAHSTQRMRAMAHTAATESLDVSNRMHARVEFYDKQWAWLRRERWLPPRRV